VFQQTSIVIGEPKHGVWRVQDNGFIREYRRYAHIGLDQDVDPNSGNLTTQQLELLSNNYASFLPGLGAKGYRYPDDRFTDGYYNYVDLSIYHPKYGGKYDDHPPIDLPHFYCTISKASFHHQEDVWRYIMAQPKDHKVGPLGIRAGLDIKENYINILRVNFFPDARIWVNVGTEDKSRNEQVKNLEDVYTKKPQLVNFQAVDLSKYDYEIYMGEAQFFNNRHLFVMFVIEHKSKPVFQYIRPDGVYWEMLNKKYQGDKDLSSILKTEKHYIPMEAVIDGVTQEKLTYQVPLYGYHSPNRTHFKMNGGACPGKGGDFSTYPWGNPGGGWPNNYEEVTPLCDAFLIDMKFWANLWVDTWNDPYLEAGPPNKDLVDYTVFANSYGRFTDPYLIRTGRKNPNELRLTQDGEIRGMPTNQTVTLSISFEKPSTMNDFVKLPDLEYRATSRLMQHCPLKCDNEIAKYWYYVGAEATQHNRLTDDPKFFRTNSELPLLPRFNGFMGTYGTYRMLNIFEQTVVFIGEPKLGLWRIQDNGFIREYRRYGKNGLRVDARPNHPNLPWSDLEIIKHNYASYMPEDNTLYKYPDDKTWNGYFQYLDLSIYHPKYEGKYNDHVPIDLPHFYVTISQADYPHAWHTWTFAKKQPMMNRIGPLGKRAGFDIKENYLNVLPLEKFQDTNLWVNVNKVVKFRAVDLSQYNYEVYIYERPLYNKPRLYLAIVMERKARRVFGYVRKSGAYWNGLVKNYKNKKHLWSINGQERYHVNFKVVGAVFPKRLVPSNVYSFQNLTGGACPKKGGDFGRYPWGDAGGGWPTNYQEITPLCNGLAIDVKFWNNLFVLNGWTDPQMGLANAPFDGGKVREYMVDGNLYGQYTDPYLVKNKRENPNILNLTPDGKIVYDAKNADKPVTIRLEYATTSYANNFYDVPEVGLSKSFNLLDYCPKKCDGSAVTVETQSKPTAAERELPTALKKFMKLMKLVDLLKK